MASKESELRRELGDEDVVAKRKQGVQEDIAFVDLAAAEEVELSIEDRRREKFRKFLEKISSDIVADYENFIVVMDLKQYYIGRIFIMAKREDARDFLSLSAHETIELKSICDDISTAYSDIDELRPDKINYAMLGNDMEHFHMHVIPRYQRPRSFTLTGEGGRSSTITFTDYNYGSNYSCTEAREFQARTKSEEDFGVAISTIKTSIQLAIKRQLSQIKELRLSASREVKFTLGLHDYKPSMLGHTLPVREPVECREEEIRDVHLTLSSRSGLVFSPILCPPTGTGEARVDSGSSSKHKKPSFLGGEDICSHDQRRAKPFRS